MSLALAPTPATAFLSASESPLNWPAIQTALKAAVSESDYATWLADRRLHSFSFEGITVSLPNEFIRHRVATHFASILTPILAAEAGLPLPVTFIVKPHFGPAAPAAAPKTEPKPFATPVLPEVPTTSPMADDLTTKLDDRYTFTSFVMGPSNEFAFRVAQQVARTPSQSGTNPLFLHGGVGLGKTHLMHAIAHEIIHTSPKTRILYLSSERFYNRFMRAMHVEKDTLKFKDMFNNVDVLMVDDIQFIAGKNSTQEEFFHTFNRLVDAGKQVILTADKPPVELDNVEDRLKSRFGCGIAAKVNAPDVDTRLAILHSKSAELGITLPEPILVLLAHTIASNVRELEGALNRLVAASRLMGRELTEDFAREQLADLFRIHTRVPTIDDIQRTVADYFKIRVADMHSPRRQRTLARPRQVAMYLCKNMLTKSYPDIGRAFGGKDHTTVMHGVKTIEALLPRDPELAEHVALLTKLLTGKV